MGYMEVMKNQEKIGKVHHRVAVFSSLMRRHNIKVDYNRSLQLVIVAFCGHIYSWACWSTVL